MTVRSCGTFSSPETADPSVCDISPDRGVSSRRRQIKRLRHKFLCDGGGKKLYRGSTPVYSSSGQKKPGAVNGGFPQNDTCVLKKIRVPVSCSSGAFHRAQASELSAAVHISGVWVFRLLLPVIAFIILNLIYHNKKDIARCFLKSPPC